MKNKNKFAAYHANQAMSLEIAAFCLLFFLGTLLSAFHLQVMTQLVDSVVAFGTLTLNIVAAIAAGRGDWYEMPLFGKYAKKAVGM